MAACYALGIPFKLTVDPLTPFGYVTGSSRFVDNSRAAISRATEGMVKLVVDRDSRKLLGVSSARGPRIGIDRDLPTDSPESRFD